MAVTAVRPDVPVERLEVAAFVVPTDAPESDGTLAWDSTTLVIVELEAAGARGLGYTYADAGAAIVARRLRDCVVGRDAMDARSRTSATSNGSTTTSGSSSSSSRVRRGTTAARSAPIATAPAWGSS